MRNIHQIKLEQNFQSLYPICRREKIEIFSLIELIKLLQLSMDKGEDLFDKRIEFSRVKDKDLLNIVLKNKRILLLDVGEEAFVVKEEMIFFLEEIVTLQKEEERKQQEYQKNYGSIYFYS